MDSREIGEWIIREANKSFRYWHSSFSCRRNMKPPFFDRNQSEEILKHYSANNPQDVA